MEKSQHSSDAMNAYLNQFCRHVVALHWLDARQSPGEVSDDVSRWDPQNFYGSAFILSVRRAWYVVTAGHILRDLDERLSAGRKIVRSNLMDGMASGSVFPPIPFILGRTEEWYVYDKDQGVDYALIPLREFFVRQLLAAGVTALEETSVGSLDLDADEYYLLGFPQEAVRTTSYRFGDTIHVTTDLGTPLLPVERVAAPPDYMKKSCPRFYGKVPNGSFDMENMNGAPQSIVGMSGGPIFAVKRTSPTSGQYWILAVQSCWDPKSRILAASPVLPLVHRIGARPGRYRTRGPAKQRGKNQAPVG